MAIAAELLSPSGPPSAADWAAVSIPAAAEMSILAAAIVASAAVAITSDDNDNQLSAGDIASSLTAAEASLLLCAPLSVATTATNSKINQELVGGNVVKGAGTTTCIIVTGAAKTSLSDYFGVNWLLNKALPRGAEFMCGPLGDIVRQYNLQKTQVVCQLHNYKKGKFLNMQVSILLTPSDLDERLHEGMAMSTLKFVSLTLARICDPDHTSNRLDFSNLCTVINSLLSLARGYIRLLASSPDDACFCLLVSVMENWIQDMAERCPKTAARVHYAQLEFDRRKESKMRAFVANFMKDYGSTGLPPADISTIFLGWLGAFLHLVLFQVWSEAICNNEKPPRQFLAVCLVGRYALPDIYYIAGWMLYSASKASMIAVDKRPLYFRFADLNFINESAANTMNLPTSLVEGGNIGHWYFVHRSILILYVLLRVFFLPISR
jgi:hypothetical protein